MGEGASGCIGRKRQRMQRDREVRRNPRRRIEDRMVGHARGIGGAGSLADRLGRRSLQKTRETQDPRATAAHGAAGENPKSTARNGCATNMTGAAMLHPDEKRNPRRTRKAAPYKDGRGPKRRIGQDPKIVRTWGAAVLHPYKDGYLAWTKWPRRFWA
jgi:hypothetical protein